MRPDMFPKDVIDALSKLRCDAPSHDMKHTRKEIQSSFGKELEEIFEFFDPEPVASGTCAQVHRARLRPDYALDNGCQDVAVKVRHPNVIWETFADFELIFQFVENSVNLIHMSFPFGPGDFKMLMQQQIDFKWEAYNLLKFDRLFGDDELIRFPKVQTDFLSPSVLVESWMPGKPVTDMLESFGEIYKDQAEMFKGKFSNKVKEQKTKLAKIVHDMSMKMFLRDNFMHGDLHGGNVLLAEDGSLTVIDTGITTSILPDWQPKFGEFLKYIVIGDSAGLTETLLAFHEGEVSKESEESFREAMHSTTNKFVSSPGQAPNGGMVDLGDFIGEIMFNLSNNNVHLRSDIAASIQSMSVSEGLIRMLDPEYDVCKASIPYFVKYGC
jgi:aarF domain-containing kinase